jgi:hypothetical protein
MFFRGCSDRNLIDKPLPLFGGSGTRPHSRDEKGTQEAAWFM